ncbi:ABC transporter substrate-binding protein [Plantactinospora sp. KLBMP9567]|uniref:ABC transporter substrate-binding protein n=1 Tax=Plantactinospora sp. KLBMP9567 TaxID=3085900 RepID=UPI002982461F|nr:ABC transporter substrate-binding protein [Plantactinospora sp. KLBMP9567]MDW5324426.1 ABC transporter substrate-binding protein [Plantactinospora sp. KLBMP9567]
MTLQRRMRTEVLAAAALALVGLVGCTTTSGGSENGGDVAQELAVAVQFPIENLDPHGASAMDNGTQIAAKAIFSPLVRIVGKSQFEGVLAESWQTNADASEWTFKLRDNVTFSDGSPVTGSDVVASFNRVVSLAGPMAVNFKDHQARVDGTDTVVITGKGPDPALLGKLVTFYVTPANQDKAGWEKPIGSGPFVLQQFAPGQNLVLGANPKYWAGKPQLDRLELRSIQEIAARMTALKTGEVGLTWAMPDDQIPALRSDPDLAVEKLDGGAVVTMWMNSSAKGLTSPAVRRALWQAVDFETIIKSLYPETGALANSVIGTNVLGYAPQTPVKYDPVAAKAALDAAGWDYGQTIRFQFSQPQFQQFTDAVASDLAKIGVKVDPTQKESAVFLQDLLALNWDLNIQQLGTAGFDAATNLGRLYTCAAKRTGYCNAELDNLLAQAGSTSDTAKRQDLYAQASKIIWDDAVGMYPMFVQIPYARSKTLQDFTLPVDGVPDFAKVRIGSDAR